MDIVKSIGEKGGMACDADLRVTKIVALITQALYCHQHFAYVKAPNGGNSEQQCYAQTYASHAVTLLSHMLFIPFLYSSFLSSKNFIY